MPGEAIPRMPFQYISRQGDTLLEGTVLDWLAETG